MREGHIVMTRAALGKLRHQYWLVLRRCALLNAMAFAAGPVIGLAPALAQSVVADGRTATSVTTQGAITDIRTGTVAGANAFNSFQRFGVDGGNTVNLHLPTGTLNLVNLVSGGEVSRIDGTLNAVLDGARIGGNVFFFNPSGVLVGTGGTINVGALTLATPTRAWVDDFFGPDGLPRPEAVGQALDVTMPIDGTGLIRVAGRINAERAVVLAGGEIVVTGSVQTGARFGATPALGFADVVNTNGLVNADRIVVEGGSIRILASGGATIDGELVADGGAGVDAGSIAVGADTIALADSARISARGHGANSDGGQVLLVATTDARMTGGATIDVRGGEVSGDGGFAEVSGQRTVTLEGGRFLGNAVQGRAGAFLIDPEDLTVSANTYTDGADLTLEADDVLTVAAGVTISTRDVGDSAGPRLDHGVAASVGDSGALTLKAREISLESGSRLLAQATGGFAAGDVTLEARDEADTRYDPFEQFSFETKTASITLDNAIIKGGVVSLTASTNTDVALPEDFLGSNGVFNLFFDKFMESLSSFAGQAAGRMSPALDVAQNLRLAVGFTRASATSTITLKGGSLVEGSGNVTLDATANAIATVEASGPKFGFGYAEADGMATIAIGDGNTGATVRSTAGDVSVTAKTVTNVTSDITTEIEVQDENNSSKIERIPTDLVLALGFSDSTTSVTIASGGVVEGLAADKSVTVSALSEKDMKVSAGGGGMEDVLGAAVAVSRSDVATSTTVAAGGAVRGAGDVTVSAEHTTNSNETSANVEIGDQRVKSLDEIISTVRDEKIKAALDSWESRTKTDDTTKNAVSDNVKTTSDNATTESGSTAEETKQSGGFAKSIGIAATSAVTLSDNNATTTVRGTVESGGDATISSKVEDAMSNTASSRFGAEGEDDGSTNQKKTAVAAAILVSDFRNKAETLITGGGAKVDAAGALNILSAVTIPYEINWGDFSDLASGWESLNERMDDTLGIRDIFFTNWAQAEAEGETTSIAGSANVMFVTNKSYARVTDGAQVNQDAAFRTADQIVTLSATTEADTWNLAGVIDFFFKFADPDQLKKLGRTKTGGGADGTTPPANGIGVSGTAVVFNTETRAEITDTVTDGTNAAAAGRTAVTGESVAVKAGTTTHNVTVAVAGGSAKSFGVNGSLTYTELNDTTIARVDDNARVTTVGAGSSDDAGTLKITATDDVLTIAIAGGILKGQASGIGAAAGINQLNRDTQAVVGDVAGETADVGAGTVNVAKTLDIAATNKGATYAASLAGAIRNNEPQTGAGAPGQTGATSGSTAGLNKSSDKGSSGIGISAAVSVNLVDDDARATVGGAGTVNTGLLAGSGDGAVSLNAINQSVIWSLAGAATINVSSSGASGLAGAFTFNRVRGTTEAELIGTGALVADGTIDVEAARGGGNVSGSGDDQRLEGGIQSLAASASGSAQAEGLQIAGSAAYAEIDNETAATVSRRAVTASSLTVEAQDDSDIWTIGGAATLGGKGGFGAGVTVNDLGNTTTAAVDDAGLTLSGGLTVTARNGNDIRSIAASLGGNTGTFQISGAASANMIDNDVTASLSGDSRASGAAGLSIGGAVSVTATDDSSIGVIAGAGGASQGTGIGVSIAVNQIDSDTLAEVADTVLAASQTLAVSATTTSRIDSLAGAVGVGQSGGVGAAVAVNRIGGTTGATITGATTDLDMTNVSVDATTDARIRNLAVGLGVAGDVGAAGSVSVNLIGNATSATIEGGADVHATGNVAVRAITDNRITSAGGSAGGGAYAGIGASAVVNEINGTTTAGIIDATPSDADETTVTADGTGSGVTVAEGSLTGSDAATGVNASFDLKNYNGPSLASRRATTSVHGIAVNAASTNMVESISVNAAGSAGVALAVNANVGLIGGSTTASIDGATVDSQADVDVRASDHSRGNSFVGAITAGIVAGTGAVDTLVLDRTTTAEIDNGAVVNADAALRVLANASQATSQFAVGGAVGGGGGLTFAGTGAISIFSSQTYALQTNSLVDAASYTLAADNASGLALTGGALSISFADNAVGGTFSLILLESDTAARISRTNGGTATDVDVSGAVSVSAANSTDFDTYAIGGAGGLAVGIAGAVTFTGITNSVDAAVVGARVGASADRVGSVDVSASDSMSGQTIAGGLGIGGAVGVGAGGNINALRNTVTARAVGATIYASGTVDITADSTIDTEHHAYMAGGGAVGIGGSATVVLAGSSTLEDEGAQEANNNGDGSLGAMGDLATSTKLAGLDGDSVLSSSERAAIESRAQRGDVAAIGAGTLANAYRTEAAVTSSTIDTTGALNLGAEDSTAIASYAGGFGVGGVGIGGGVNYTRVERNVSAVIGGTSHITTGGALGLTALADTGSGSIDVNAYAAGVGGAVGVGAAFAYGLIDNNVQARATGASISTGNAITVSAADTQSLDTSAFGAGASLGVAVGAVVSDANRSSTVTAEAGNSGGIITTSNDALSVTASVTGDVAADAKGGAVGTYSGAGMDVRASDRATVTAATGEGEIRLGTGALLVQATTVPHVSATTDAVNIGGLSVGVSLANAEALSTVTTRLAGLIRAGDVTAIARADRTGLAAGSNSVRTDSFAAGGGLLAGVNATIARSVAAVDVTTETADETDIIASGDIMLGAVSDTQQKAKVDAYNGGALAVGANTAYAGNGVLVRDAIGTVTGYSDREAVTEVVIGTGTSLAQTSAARTAGKLATLDASGQQTNLTDTTSGQGGVISGVSATGRTKTLTRTAVTLEDSSVAGSRTTLTVGDAFIQARQVNNFNAQLDSINASIAGGSGAYADNFASARTTVTLGDYATLLATDAEVVARNSTVKTAAAGGNIESGSGGVIDAPAAESNTVVDQRALVEVGDNATITVQELASVPLGSLTLQARNSVSLADYTSLVSGGAIAVADARSFVEARVNEAHVVIGEDADLAAAQDIVLSATSGGGVSARATADVWGAAGAPDTDVAATYRADNLVQVKSGVEMLAGRDLSLLAGDPATQTVTVTARSFFWNKSAFPVNGSPDADALIVNNNRVIVEGPVALVPQATVDGVVQYSVNSAGTDLKARRNVNVVADRGIELVSGVGIGKDFYREVAGEVASFFSNLVGGGDVSFDIRDGTQRAIGTESALLDGTLRAGIDSVRDIRITSQEVAGSLVVSVEEKNQATGQYEAANGLIDQNDPNVSIADDLRQRIARLERLKADFNTGDAGDAAAIAAYDAEIAFLQQKLRDLGAANPTFAGSSSESLYQLSEQQLTAYETLRTDQQTIETTRDGAVADSYALIKARAETVLAAQPEPDDDGYDAAFNASLTALIAAAGAATPDEADVSAKLIGLAGRDATLDSLAATRTADISARDAAADEATRYDAFAARMERNLLTSDNGTLNVDAALIARELAFTGGDENLEDQLPRLLAGGDDIYSTVAGNTAWVAPFVRLKAIDAQSGNVSVTARSILGTGQLMAPGDTAISVLNETPAFLTLTRVRVDDSDGGRVIINGADVSSAAQVGALAGGVAFTGTVVSRGSEGVNPPSISIASTYDPRDPTNLPDAVRQDLTLEVDQRTSGRPSPDIRLGYYYTDTDGDTVAVPGLISNARGNVSIASESGNIVIDAGSNIQALSVDITARAGDYIQSYRDGFSHVAGDPALCYLDAAQCRTEPQEMGSPNDSRSVLLDAADAYERIKADSTVTGANAFDPDTSGIFANGSVFIAARYLNVNGTIRSGMPDWSISIAANPQVVVNGVTTSLAAANADWAARSATPGANPYYELVGTTTSSVVESSTGLDAAGNPTGQEIIPVFYNAQTGTIEVRSTSVAGGYIELYGQIFNTTPTDADGNARARLEVLDGYGRISVNNQSGLALDIVSLDAGSGTEGLVRINNIVGQTTETRQVTIDDGLGNSVVKDQTITVPIVETWEYRRSGVTKTVNGVTTDVGSQPAGDRTGQVFNPQTGLRYVWSYGTDTTTVESFRYWRRGWFGQKAWTIGGINLDEYRIGQYASNDSLSTGSWLGFDGEGSAGVGNYDDITTNRTLSQVYTEGRSWSECDPWFCITSRFYQEFTRTTGTKMIENRSLAADYPIAVNYIGYDTGAVTITSNATINLLGAIRNEGTTTVTATSGSINAVTGVATIGGKDISLSAATGSIGLIDNGAVVDAIRVAQATGGSLSATASGDININNAAGGFNVIGVTSATGSVTLAAQGDIAGVTAASQISGARITLESRGGAIHGQRSDGTLAIQADDTGAATEIGLAAHAAGDIKLAQQSGDLLVDQVVSTGGDVVLSAAGSILDNNPVERIDASVQQELVDLWDALRLKGAEAAAKAEEQVARIEAQRTQDYKSYWRYRALQADPSVYDPDFVVEVGGIAQPELTASYHALHATYGGLGNSYDAGYQVTLDRTGAEYLALTENVAWSDTDLAFGAPAGAMKELTDTNPVLKDPNVSGRNITLKAGSGIGTDAGEIRIAADADPLALSNEIKAALAAAERGDLRVDDDTGELVITPRKQVNVASQATGTLTVSTTAGNAYVGGEGDLVVDSITAPGEVRVKGGGTITVTGGSAANIAAAGAILEAATGGLGTSATPIRVTLGAGGLTARAQDSIFVTASGDLAVDTLFSRADVTLAIPTGDLIRLTPAGETTIRAASINLVVNGDIGSASDPLQVGVDTDGLFSATSLTGSLYAGSLTQPLLLGDTTAAGDIVFTAGRSGLSVLGTVVAGGQLVFDAPTGLVVIGDGWTVTGDTGLSVTAARFSAGAGAGLFTDGDLRLAIALDTSFGNGATAGSGDDLLLESATLVLADGTTLGASDGLTLSTTDTMTFGHGVALSGATLALGAGGMSIGDDAALTAGSGDLGLTAGSLSVGNGAMFTAGRDQTLTVTGALALGNTAALTAARDLALGAGAVTLGDDATLTAGSGDFGLVADSLSVGNGAMFTAGRDQRLTVTGALALGNNAALTAARDLALAATGITLGDDATLGASTGALSLDSGIAALAVGARGHLGGTSIALAGGAVTIGADSVVTATLGDLAIATPGSVDLGPNMAATAQGAMTLSAGGDADFGAGTRAQASGITVTAANVRLGAAAILDSGTDALDLTATTGRISGNGPLDDASLRAGAMTLTAADTIGADGTPMVISATGTLNASAPNGIWLKQLGGALAADELLAGDGTLDVEVVSGGLTADTVTGVDVAVEAAGDVVIAHVVARDLVVATDADGLLDVARLDLERSAVLRAATIRLGDVQGAGDPLDFDIAGGNDGLAQSLDMQASNGGDITFSNLRASNAVLRLATPRVTLASAEIGDRLELFNEGRSLLVDNGSPRIETSFEVQLRSGRDPLFLDLPASGTVLTDAFVLNYRPGTVVNEFSSDNSMTLLVPRLLQSVQTPAEGTSPEAGSLAMPNVPPLAPPPPSIVLERDDSKPQEDAPVNLGDGITDLSQIRVLN